MKVSRIVFLVLFVVSICATRVGAEVIPDWPDIFDPTLLVTLNIEMNPADWNDVVNDETLSIEKPAWFWADGEEGEKLFISLRRKSGDPIPSSLGGDEVKISLKLDINDYISGQEWHGLTKLSLENGDDNNVLTEGIACNIHSMASGSEGYGYDAWRGNWVKLYVNGQYRGVYVNAEHLDKKFLQNRGLYVWHETWLYQYRGEYSFTLEIGDDLNPRSPTVNELCYLPFPNANASSPLHPDGGLCSVPDDTTMTAQLDELINMRGMLSMAAVNAFVANPDSLFSHQRNSHFLDFNTDNPLETRKRMYFPWDVDAAFQRTDFDIYSGNRTTEYQTLILANPVFREQYDHIMCDLIGGPLSEGSLLAFVDTIEPVLTDALAADPYNKFGSTGLSGVVDAFDGVRAWLSARVVDVRTQVNCRCGNIDGKSGVDFGDFGLVADDWLLSGTGLAGDVDGDGTVDANDLEIISYSWLVDCE